MTLDNIYLISQIIAVVALVPSLLYLAVQVRQNTKQMRASASYQFVEATADINLAAATDPVFCSMFHRGMEDYHSLADLEKGQFTHLAGHLYQVYSVLYEHHRDGTLPESQWHAVKKDILSLRATSGGAEVWNALGRTAYDQGFVGYVDGLVATDDRYYSLTGRPFAHPSDRPSGQQDKS